MDLSDANDLPAAHFLAAAGPARGQMELELEALLDAKPGSGGKMGNYTGERLKREDPHRYELCVLALAKGTPRKKIAEALDISWRLVRAIEIAESSGAISHEKKKLADALLDVLEASGEALLQKALDGKISELGHGILTDKYLLLRGEATSITETRGEDPAVTAYLEHVRQMGLRAADEFAKGGAARPVAGVVVEMEPESGAGGVKPPAEDVQPVDDQH